MKSVFLEFDLEGSSLQICLNKNKEKGELFKDLPRDGHNRDISNLVYISLTVMQHLVNHIQRNSNLNASKIRSCLKSSEN